MRHAHFSRRDPGPCPICDAAHCSCGGGGPITVVQLPQRDAAFSGPMPQADGDPRPLGDGTDGRSFSTATYRGTRKQR